MFEILLRSTDPLTNHGIMTYEDYHYACSQPTSLRGTPRVGLLIRGPAEYIRTNISTSIYMIIYKMKL